MFKSHVPPHLPFAVIRRWNLKIKSRFCVAEFDGLEEIKHLMHFLHIYFSTHPHAWTWLYFQLTGHWQIRIEEIFKLGTQVLHVLVDFACILKVNKSFWSILKEKTLLQAKWTWIILNLQLTDIFWFVIYLEDFKIKLFINFTKLAKLKTFSLKLKTL